MIVSFFFSLHVVKKKLFIPHSIQATIAEANAVLDPHKLYVTMIFNSYSYRYQFSPLAKIAMVMKHFLPFYGHRIITPAILDQYALVRTVNRTVGFPMDLTLSECNLVDNPLMERMNNCIGLIL